MKPWLPVLLALAGCSGSSAISVAETGPAIAGKVLFDCAANGHRAVLSASAGQLALVVKKGGSVIATARSNAGWDNLHLGYVNGQQGGHQSHLRLTMADSDYIVLEGEDGQLSDSPGHTYASVVRTGRTATDASSATLVECSPVNAINSELVQSVSAAAKAAGKPVPAHEAEGSDFDGWL